MSREACHGILSTGCLWRTPPPLLLDFSIQRQAQKNRYLERLGAEVKVQHSAPET